MKISIDEFRRKYPALYNELFSQDSMSIVVSFEKTIDDPWRGYIPGPVDYIRRAKSLDEALQVIDYLERHGEISSDEARMYREKLLNEGLDAFGPRKEDNYYYKKAMEYWRKLSLQQQRLSGEQQ